MRARILRRLSAVAAAAFAFALLFPTVAHAQYPGGQPSPGSTVGGEKFFRGNEGLGTTGSNILLILFVALMLLGLGLVVRRFSRRTTPSES